MLNKQFLGDTRNPSRASGSNAAAIVTISAATPARRAFIHGVQWSYDADPTGGKLTFSDGTLTWEVDITKGGPGGFALGYLATQSADVTITLAAGGAGITGKLNVQYTLEAA